ncbi:hypothetical protein B0H19DRAFT_1252155 [Mycena capillaripes]|nr:hypothetical protein B0H19DRAFT_1252155 [Mycena capillaripes]
MATEQDGWTVLAPPEQPELPPPYAPEDPSPPAPAPAPAPAAVAAAPMLLQFQIPTNSNIVGAAVPVTRTKSYGRDVPFAVGYPEICHMMGLNAAHACLGYKWDKDKNLPEETARAASAAASTSTGTKKRKAPHGSVDSPKTFDYTKEYRELKKHLGCTTHKDEFCYVLPTDGHHHRVDNEHASLWAKEISVGNATSIRPPENIMFQEFFLPAPKRAHRSARNTQSETNLCAPTIHVTVNTGTSAGGNSVSPSPPRRSPLGTITAATANAGNINILSSLYRSQLHSLDNDENRSFPRIRYAPVTEILQQIDDSGIFADSVLEFPAIIFADKLAQSQITHVDQVPLLDTELYVQVVHMPLVLAELFVEESITAMGRAQKGKGRL